MKNTNTELSNLFEGIKPTRKATVEVTVELAPSRLLERLATIYHNEISRLNLSRDPNIDEISVQDMYRYFNTLMYMRVGRIEGSLHPSYQRIYRNVVVPTLVYQITISIGHAEDKDYGIEFLPAYTINGDDLLSADELLSISDRLSMLENNGLAMVYGLSNDPEGVLDFMAMSYAQEELYSYREVHPVQAFMSAFFQRKMSEDFFDGLSRMRYGDVGLYQSSLYRAIRAADGGSHE